MSLLTQKTEYSKRGSYDELYTPSDAVDMILEYIPSWVASVWECTDFGGSNITSVLSKSGYKVISTSILNGDDFFSFEPSEYDIIITNPPYSIKDKFLERAFSLNKPFMFLLPITSLEGKKRGGMFSENGIQVIIPNKRFNFITSKDSGAWFQTSWFTHGLSLDNDLIFHKV